MFSFKQINTPITYNILWKYHTQRNAKSLTQNLIHEFKSIIIHFIFPHKEFAALIHTRVEYICLAPSDSTKGPIYN